MCEISVKAKTENLNAVLDFVGDYIGDCSAKIQNQIGIVIDEVFSNISNYAYNPNVGDVAVRVKVGHDIVLEFEDCGVEYNPLLAKEPDTSLGANERDVGGLGLFMVRNIMDSVTYKRDGNRNILTIKKVI
jgi:anti-sigma regulatory factor (Ser/Thr protein kinase)